MARGNPMRGRDRTPMVALSFSGLRRLSTTGATGTSTTSSLGPAVGRDTWRRAAALRAGDDADRARMPAPQTRSSPAHDGLG